MTRIVACLLLILLARGSWAEVFRDWTTMCDTQGCRTYTTTKHPYDHPDYQKYFLAVLEITPQDEVLFSGLYDLSLHKQIFTSRPPIELRHEGKNYVATDYFTPNRQKYFDLYVDNIKITQLNVIDDSHLAFKLSSDMRAALEQGTNAVIRPQSDGDYQYRFSLLGFTAAYNARLDTKQIDEPKDANPIAVVSKHLPGNRWSLMPEDLISRKNPYGDGSFVYFPRFSVSGYERLVIWFVHYDQAVKLNGATHHVTPSVPYPRELGYKFWRGTGLTKDDVTKRGLSLAYGE